MKDQEEEIARKEQALNTFEVTRKSLIQRGKEIANELYAKNGSVTSPQVVDRLEKENFPGINQVDRRFMGAVFRKGWERVGFVAEGSHSQPISKWVQKTQ